MTTTPKPLTWQDNGRYSSADVDDDTFASIERRQTWAPTTDPAYRWMIEGFRSDKNIADVLAVGGADSLVEAKAAAEQAVPTVPAARR